ncbi:GSCOCG00008097001-RA-CDS [Cotesia congregata]|nr:GSCOCG00008097001-RA-CDS [Cotesia congregata]
MTATKPLEIPLPLKIKKEKEESISSEDCDNDDLDTDSDSTSSMLLQPSIFQNDSLSRIDPNNFLRLTSMVRRIYFSYLYKSIVKNYNTCCRSIKSEKFLRCDLKKFSSLLELDAVKASIETSLYRQAVLKIISDVKKDTVNNKIHNKLAVYLDTPSKTVDVAVQTCSEELEDNYSVLNCGGDNVIINNTQQDINYPYLLNSVPVFDEVNSLLSDRLYEQSGERETLDDGEELNNTSVITSQQENSQDRVSKNIADLFDNFNDVDNIDEDTHDTLVQNLETMFGESDDSSDLMALIEKHSSINKPSIDMEPTNTAKIINYSKNTTSNFTLPSENNSNSCVSFDKLDDKKTKIKEFKVNYGGKRKVSFTDYKKLKKRALEDNKTEDKQTKKMRNVWLVERIHQESKLRTKMLELSLNNYRKYGKVKEKFKELFGEENDDEEMMPAESPIHIEEHLNGCKERIAPWVVKYLMPYYEEKISGNKLLFKAEACVNNYIKDYFKNKTCIKTEADVYI